MVELFEKCLIVGIGFTLALSLYTPLLNLYSKVYGVFSEDQIKSLAQEVDKAVERAYMFKGEYSISCIVPGGLSLRFEDGVLKIFCEGKVFTVGCYNFNVVVEDRRAFSGFTRISFKCMGETVFIVMEDAV